MNTHNDNERPRVGCDCQSCINKRLNPDWKAQKQREKEKLEDEFTRLVNSQISLIDKEIAVTPSLSATRTLREQRDALVRTLEKHAAMISPTYVLDESGILKVPPGEVHHMDHMIIDDLVSPPCGGRTATEQNKIDEAFKALIRPRPPQTASVAAKQQKIDTAAILKAKRSPVLRPRFRQVAVAMSALGHLFEAAVLGAKFSLELDLPQGSRLVRWFPHQMRDCICLVFEHESFPELEEGAEIPMAPPGEFRLHEQ